MVRETELYHHGTKGMQWGVRRYQNKDGSLTYAGKQRALKMRNKYTEFSKDSKFRDKEGNLTYKGRKKNLKMQEQYSALTGKRLTTFPNKKPGDASKDEAPKPKPKKISEMTDQELREKVTRLNLENDYKRLTAVPPPKEKFSKTMVKKIRDKAADKIIEKGTSAAADYFDKKLRAKTGLSTKSKADQLKALADEYTSRMRIDMAQKQLGEGKYKTTS